jgi:hypothetical protein
MVDVVSRPVAEGRVEVGVKTDSDREIAVEVDIMSGVPNPTWTARGSAAQDIADLLHGLVDTGKGDAAASLQLGFRGFVLRGKDLTGSAGLDQARVLGTKIIATKPNAFAGRILSDADRSVYTLLRTMSEQHLDDNIVQAIPLEGLKGSP